MNAIKHAQYSFLTIVLLSFSSLVLGATVIPPEPLSQEGIEFPGFGAEGLHIARFTVKADGTTSDVEVVGGFTNQFATPMIEGAVKSWRYMPATVDGEAVDIYNQEAILRAKLFDQMTITTKVQEEVDSILTMVTEGQYDDALNKVKLLLTNGAQSVSDWAVLQEVRTGIYMAMEDNFSALESSKLATISTENADHEKVFMLTPVVLEAALRKQVLLAATLGQDAEVMRAFEMLDSNFTIAADDSIMNLVDASRNAIASPNPIGLKAKIVEDNWTYEPARRVFTVIDVEGEVSSIDVRCERRNLTLDFEEGIEWALPESFGKCQLDFNGKDNTEFTMYEFAE